MRGYPFGVRLFSGIHTVSARTAEGQWSVVRQPDAAKHK